jgi:hypothetical protein
MITKYLKKNNPICNYFDSEQVMMTNKQRRTLTELIYEKVQDEDTREQYLNQINDDLSYSEAQDMILELSI